MQSKLVITMSHLTQNAFATSAIIYSEHTGISNNNKIAMDRCERNASMMHDV